jgi:uncharacterized membrane protein YjgN (DUF898 family)
MSDEAGPSGKADEESAEQADGAARLSFRFTGATAEYFRIWIVNLCLTLFTAGVFSAWAKVRKKRYLYSHTLLGRTPFQYLGRPLPVLKGRMVAAVLGVTWYVVTNLVPEFSWLVALAAFGLAPWAIARSVAFTARYSAYRNLTFCSRSTYGGVAGTLYGWSLVTLATCGLAYPCLRQRLTRYLVSHTEFGGVPARFRASVGQYIGSYFVAGLLVGGPLGIFVVSFAADKHAPSVEGLQIVFVAVYLLYFVAFAYLRAKITNLVWNGTELGPLRFVCTLSARSLLWIYFTNTLAVFASAGLLIPWATIRTMRYRAKQFAVHLTGDLREFAGSDCSTVQAAGAEVGEFFDLDVAL